jgi:hypothetical protein
MIDWIGVLIGVFIVLAVNWWIRKANEQRDRSRFIRRMNDDWRRRQKEHRP